MTPHRVARGALAAAGLALVGVDVALLLPPGGHAHTRGQLHYVRLADGTTLCSAADIEAGIVPKGRFVPVYP